MLEIRSVLEVAEQRKPMPPLLFGGTASNTVVSSGGSLVVLSRGIADPAAIYSGGSEIISTGGTDLGGLISGGTQIDSGFVNGATVFAGSQVVRSARRR